MIYGDEIECTMCYFILVSFLYLPTFLLACIAAAFVAPRSWKGYEARVAKLALFFVISLMVGAFFGCVWGDTMWGRFYYSTDYCGFDFVPFWPMTQARLDQPWGNDPHGLVGVSLTQLNLIWLLFATATWSLTVGLYGYIVRRFASGRSNLPHRLENDMMSSWQRSP